MAKTYVKNKLGSITKGFNLPCDDTVAVTFMDTFCVGEYAIYSETSTSGSDAATSYNLVNVMVKDSAGVKHTLVWHVKALLVKMKSLQL